VIALSDPGALYRERQAEIDEAVSRVLESGRYILGDEVGEFEREFAAHAGGRHGVGVASGTDAIECALRACGVGAGDEVFTVSHTAGATVAAVLRCGAVPVLTDVDPITGTMDPEQLARALTHRTRSGRRAARAVIPVHLHGRVADMPAILEVARTFGLMVIEDCAQAHGAALDGRRAGSWGNLAAFSFYPTKNLPAMGDAGLVICQDDTIAAALRSIREYGWKERQVSSRPGVNSRLDTIQAAILRVQLRFLDADNARRRRNAAIYDAALRDGTVITPAVTPGSVHAYHQYVIRVAGRETLRGRLRERGIETGVHYPVPVHLQSGFRELVKLGSDLGATERFAGEILSLPVHPTLSTEAVSHVARCVREAADLVRHEP
jgi:dTDP-4-amino-4,6-dideoxygalactose transaminase